MKATDSCSEDEKKELKTRLFREILQELLIKESESDDSSSS
ncbi:hypothetical protein [Halobacillus aidingensis]|uniref:Uncharacterized protein n=1 Tax=Halobacillus aidingensis TaxID=240303 RepID=A0A1H0MJX4_HALAD|nr:hypothetical protein [Halobacillus aidingensis]SDO80677.1 hypothetical protein SAMN05421677_10860 [Halobacillus aidingensis]